MIRKAKSEGAGEFKRLYEGGESLKIIANRFGLHFSTVRDHLIKKGVRIRSLKEAGVLASNLGRIAKHKIPDCSRKLTKEKAYILGVMCGDGYLHCTKNKSYQIGLQACDKDFVMEFRRCIMNVYDLTLSLKKIKIRRENWNDKWMARICCKEIYNDIYRYGTFKMKSWRVPKSIFESSEDMRCSFLGGFFDSEGSVDKWKKIVAVSVNRKGMHEIKKLLLSLGVKSNVHRQHKRSNRSIQSILNITGRQYIELYAQKVGFHIKRKQTKLDKLIIDYKFFMKPHKEIKKLERKMAGLRDKGLSYEKIGKDLDISTATVWNYLNNKHKLRQ